MSDERREAEVAGPSQPAKQCGDTGSTASEVTEANRCNQSGMLPGMLPLEPRRDAVTSIRQLADRLGVSHAALLRAEKDQRIAPLGKGPYDVEKVHAEFTANTKRTRPRAARAKAAVTSPPPRAISADAPTADDVTTPMLPAADQALVAVPAEATAIIVETLREAGIAVAGEPTLRQAGVALEILRGMKAKVEVDRLRGRSADKAKLHDVLTRHTRTIRNHLLAWPRAVAPTLAREVGLGDHRPLEMALDAHLRARLELIASLPPPAELVPAP